METNTNCDHSSKQCTDKLSKLRKELANDKESRILKIWRMLLLCLCVDIVLIAIFAQTSNNNLSIFSILKLQSLYLGIFDLYNDTIDCCIAILLKWLVLLIFQTVFLKYSHPDNFRNISPNYTQSKVIKCILLIWKHVFMHSNQSDIIFRKSDNNKAGTELAPKGNKRKIMDCNDVMHRYQFYNQYDIANFIDTFSWFILLIMVCIFQTFIAIKMIFYHSNSYNIQIITTICIISGRLEIYLMGKYKKCFQETYYKYFNYDLHDHWLKSTINPGAWCDICWQRNYIDCYRCDDCDFDICQICWDKSINARVAADNQLRNDKGDIYKKKYIDKWEYIKKLTKMHLKYKEIFIMACLSMFGLSLISLNMPDYEGKLINYIFKNDLKSFYDLVIIYLFISIIYLLFKFMSDYTFSRVSQQTLSTLQKTVFQRLMKQDMVFHDGTSAEYRNDVLNDCAQQMFKPFEKSIRLIMASGIEGIGSLIMCYFISWKLTLISISTVAPFNDIMREFDYFLYMNFNKTWTLKRDIKLVSVEGFDNIKTIRSFAKEHLFIKAYKNITNEISERSKKVSILESISGTMNSWIDISCIVLIIWASGSIVFNQNDNTNAFTLGSLVTFRLYWSKWTLFANEFSNIIREIKQGCTEAQDVFALLEFEPSIEPNDDNDDDGIVVKELGDIQFKNVCYSYQMSPNKQVLSGLNFIVQKNKITAIVGKSGAGKTTLINLILRLYDVTDGEILMNGINIKNLNIYSWRKNISIVTQDTELFNKSIADNIGFGCNENEYDLNELKTYCQLANANEFIINLENKYLSKCGNKGIRLSGGQKQRISIARMLISKPSLMILDEATSSLDSESESLVQKSLDAIMKYNTCTIIVIAHRLSTIFNSDQIIVIDNGKIVQIGKHHDLMKDTKCNIYANLVQKQTNINLQSQQKQQIKHDISLIA